jgi:hypothetical protein
MERELGDHVRFLKQLCGGMGFNVEINVSRFEF